MRLKEIAFWTYIAAVIAAITYAVYSGNETKTAGEIIYENAHAR